HRPSRLPSTSFRHYASLHSFPTRRSSDLFAISEVPVSSNKVKSGNKLTFINTYGNSTGIKIGSILEVGKEYTISFKVKLLSGDRSEEHTSELQSRFELVCRLLPETQKSRR